MVSLSLVMLIGAVLGAIASSITIVEGIIFLWKQGLVQETMWPCAHNVTLCEGRTSPRPADFALSYVVYVLLNLALVLGAALLTYWAPRAALSGLPPLLAYLNGVTPTALPTSTTSLSPTPATLHHLHQQVSNDHPTAMSLSHSIVPICDLHQHYSITFQQLS